MRPDDLLAGTLATLMARSPFRGEDVEDVIAGCTNQAGEDCRNVARRAGLLAGLPVEVAGMTLNRLCASGLAAVVDASRAVACGQGDLFIAGGVESMSRAPFLMAKSEKAYGRQVTVFDSTLGSRFSNPRATAQYGDHAMPETADHIAVDLAITREESDRFASASQQRFARAKKDCFYKAELDPVTVPGPTRGETTIVTDDEHPRPGTTVEQLGRLATRRGATTAPRRSSSAAEPRVSAPAPLRWRVWCRRRLPASSPESWDWDRCRPPTRRWRGPGCRCRTWM